MIEDRKTGAALRRWSLAGVLSLSVLAPGATGAALGMPVTTPPALKSGGVEWAVTAIQYGPYGYGYRRPYFGYRRPVFGFRAYPYRRFYGYRGRAGVYNCGPYSYKTRLSRRACR